MTSDNNAACIYLDHNATTPLHPAVRAAMAECADLANPSSQHAAGRRARQVLEDARERIAELLGVNLHGRTPDRVIFTSGGTEANNLALFGLARPQPGTAIISVIEHPSLTAAANELARRGWQIDKLAVNRHGVVDISELPEKLSERPDLVSLMLANNETGVVQPIREAAEICRAADVLLHTDAAQAIGKLCVSFRDLGVAAMTIAPHKFQGPCGIGALAVRGDVDLRPQLFGGFQQQGLRPGTEPVALVVGLCRALEVCQVAEESRYEAMRALRDRLEARLQAGCPNLVINGSAAPRLPNTSNLSFTGLDRQALLMAFDLAGVECSTGSACASGSSELSPCLLAMGLPRNEIQGSIRLSLGPGTSLAEVDEASERILRIVKDLQSRKNVGKIDRPARQA